MVDGKIPLFEVSLYIKKIAAIVVTISPVTTGIRFRLASSNGSTLQIAAAGIKAHGTSVPLPTKDKMLFY
ncbi:hypothetical protein [Neobacillus mesonae]|uniref:hypothetical protein n=1 Tax=Neobacillus mesonae TaxID=1193713 RepID=UPI00203CF3DE|nr:hypothetical protein [Neobacillus mesonae]MCM3567890.1 hypothetical protein [Neobacillus mesonae]